MIETVHCINLWKREDRLLAVAKEAKQQGFSLFIHEGIDAIERVDTKRAICLSHKKIVQYAKDNNLPEIIIAEDDMQWFGEGAFQYYIDNKPKHFDLYCATIFDGQVGEDLRIKNGMSATMTCYTIASNFYDILLNDIADDSHIDRELGNLAFKYRYFVPPLLCCTQRQGYSDNRKCPTGDYSVYLQDRKIYGRDTV